MPKSLFAVVALAAGFLATHALADPVGAEGYACLNEIARAAKPRITAAPSDAQILGETLLRFRSCSRQLDILTSCEKDIVSCARERHDQVVAATYLSVALVFPEASPQERAFLSQIDRTTRAENFPSCLESETERFRGVFDENREAMSEAFARSFCEFVLSTGTVAMNHGFVLLKRTGQ